MAPRGRSKRPARGSEAGQADEAAATPQAGKTRRTRKGCTGLMTSSTSLEHWLLQWRSRIDRMTLGQFRWTPYDTPELQALIPDWMRSQFEVNTWRSAVPVVCFNFVHMHHIDRVEAKMYGGQIDSVRGTTGGGVGGLSRRGRFLSRARNLADPRWNLDPPNIPPAAVHPRDDLVMPDDAPAPHRQQRRRARMVEVGAAAHVAEERAEEQQEYERQDDPGDDVQCGEPGPDDHDAHDQPGFGIHEQHDFQPTQDPTISPSGMITFSPAAARAYPSPYHAGTSSHPEYGSDHPPHSCHRLRSTPN
ncbi:hypothetical protein PIB30_051835 [Stylosanthes scabra]|uniref:Aminotransferase-like plant mobile domain-containing protein n=1 Tax=Stylosanthes scabra TaxID=79078 RepID=A0ABU6XH51_9FABA|nr:hypothetical protein [Stylosanthes scabra]